MNHPATLAMAHALRAAGARADAAEGPPPARLVPLLPAAATAPGPAAFALPARASGSSARDPRRAPLAR